METFKLLMLLIIVALLVLVFSPLILAGLIANFSKTAVLVGWELGERGYNALDGLKLTD